MTGTKPGLESDGSDFQGLAEEKLKDHKVVVGYTWYVNWTGWLERLWSKLKGGETDA